MTFRREVLSEAISRVLDEKITRGQWEKKTRKARAFNVRLIRFIDSIVRKDKKFVKLFNEYKSPNNLEDIKTKEIHRYFKKKYADKAVRVMPKVEDSLDPSELKKVKHLGTEHFFIDGLYRDIKLRIMELGEGPQEFKQDLALRRKVMKWALGNEAIIRAAKTRDKEHLTTVVVDEVSDEFPDIIIDELGVQDIVSRLRAAVHRGQTRKK